MRTKITLEDNNIISSIELPNGGELDIWTWWTDLIAPALVGIGFDPATVSRLVQEPTNPWADSSDLFHLFEGTEPEVEELSEDDIPCDEEGRPLFVVAGEEGLDITPGKVYEVEGWSGHGVEVVEFYDDASDWRARPTTQYRPATFSDLNG